MRQRVRLLSLGFVLVLAAGRAEQWEVGGAGGFGKYRSVSVTSPAGTAAVGIATQAAVGLVIGEDLYRFIGGEFRYTYRDGDLTAKSGGQEGSLEGRSHALHYDFLFHATRKGSRFRPFAAAGAGIKAYQGVGRESAFQPLSQYVLLTKTDQFEPLISFGGGVKIAISKHTLLRFDFRDYVTPTPNHLFAPVAHGSVQGWLHDFVPLAGVSAVF